MTDRKDVRGAMCALVVADADKLVTTHPTLALARQHALRNVDAAASEDLKTHWRKVYVRIAQMQEGAS